MMILSCLTTVALPPPCHMLHLLADEESLLDVEELVLLALGSALGVLLVAALVLGVVRLRRPAPRQELAKKSSPIITVATPSSNVEDDRNPDVVPQKGEFWRHVL